MQINNVRARLFLPKTSIFTHFFQIYAHACAKKAVILQREIMFKQGIIYEKRS